MLVEKYLYLLSIILNISDKPTSTSTYSTMDTQYIDAFDKIQLLDAGINKVLVVL